MARKLKTYITSSGFFDLAVAAPSMKAALEAWGMTRNAFQQGFAEETYDPKIIAAATAVPGVVVKRPVGSKGEYNVNAELPQDLPSRGESRPQKLKAKSPAKPKQEPAQMRNDEADRAAIISFEKERAQRDRERAREEVTAGQQRMKRQSALDKAQAELDSAQKLYEAEKDDFQEERNKLDRREALAEERWDAHRKKLQAAVVRARKP